MSINHHDSRNYVLEKDQQNWHKSTATVYSAIAMGEEEQIEEKPD